VLTNCCPVSRPTALAVTDNVALAEELIVVGVTRAWVMKVGLPVTVAVTNTGVGLVVESITFWVALLPGATVIARLAGLAIINPPPPPPPTR